MTSDPVSPRKRDNESGRKLSPEQAAAAAMVAEAKARGLELIGPNGLLRRLAVELVGELRRIDRRIAEATQALSDAVAASGTTLTRLLGVGDVVAAKLLARTGPISR